MATDSPSIELSKNCLGVRLGEAAANFLFLSDLKSDKNRMSDKNLTGKANKDAACQTVRDKLLTFSCSMLLPDSTKANRIAATAATRYNPYVYWLNL